MVQHRVPEHEVETLIRERQLGRVRRFGAHPFQPEALGVVLECCEHSRRDVGTGGVTHDAGLEQVEAEVAGTGADLE